MLIIMVLVWMASGTCLHAEGEAGVQVASGGVGLEVMDRELVGAGEAFTAKVGRLYCLTRITGAETPTTVSHVWIYNDEERARVVLPVRSKSWRTYSSKRIQPLEVGRWRVEVRDAQERVLESFAFDIVSED